MARSTLIVLLALKAIALTLAVFGQWWAAAIVYFVPDLWVLYHLFVPSGQGLCPVVTRFDTPRAEVWLTIDDGPDETDTPQILDLLDRFGAKATFFVIGERAKRCPKLIAEIAQRGHEIAHHTQTHPVGTFWCASPARLSRELDDAIDTLRPSGIRPRWFRPPVGIKHLLLPAALAARQLRCVGWSIRSGDVLVRSHERVVAHVLRKLRPGAIILMHEGPSLHPAVRVRAIALLLEALSGLGYRCVLPDPSQFR